MNLLTQILFSFLLFSFLIIFTSNKAEADTKIDSLLQQLSILEIKKSSQENDSLIISTLITISTLYSYCNTDSALIYLKKALPISQKRNWNWAYQRIFIGYGNIYLMLNDYSASIKYYLKALEIAEKTNNKKNLAAILNNIGIVYQEQNMHKEAIDYFNKAFEQFKNNGNIQGEASALTGIGEIYKTQKKYEEALKIHLEVLKIAQNNNNQRRIAIAYHNIGEIYGELGEFDKAINFLKKGMVIDKQLGLESDIVIDINVIAKVLYKKKEYKKAIEYAQKAKILAEKMHIKDEIKNAAEILYLSYKSLNNYHDALLNYEIFNIYKDSLLNRENIIKLSSLEKEFALAKNQYKMDLLIKENEKKDMRKNLTILTLVALVLTTILIIFHIQKKSQIRKLQHEKKLAEIAHLNAHETRAPLATLLGLLHLINKEKLQDKHNIQIIDMMVETAYKLDKVIHQINDKAQKQE